MPLALYHSLGSKKVRGPLGPIIYLGVPDAGASVPSLKAPAVGYWVYTDRHVGASSPGTRSGVNPVLGFAFDAGMVGVQSQVLQSWPVCVSNARSILPGTGVNRRLGNVSAPFGCGVVGGCPRSQAPSGEVTATSAAMHAHLFMGGMLARTNEGCTVRTGSIGKAQLSLLRNESGM